MRGFTYRSRLSRRSVPSAPQHRSRTRRASAYEIPPHSPQNGHSIAIPFRRSSVASLSRCRCTRRLSVIVHRAPLLESIQSQYSCIVQLHSIRCVLWPSSIPSGVYSISAPHIGQVSPTCSFAQVAHSEPSTVRSLIGTDRFHVDSVTEPLVIVTEF